MEDGYVEIGMLDITLLKKIYNVQTKRLIITKERIEHINKKHTNDYELYGHHMLEIITNPDYILKDVENLDTVLYLKSIKELNLQLVIKLHTENNKEKANTIITFWHMRERSYKQIIKKNEKIFKKVDKEE